MLENEEKADEPDSPAEVILLTDKTSGTQIVVGDDVPLESETLKQVAAMSKELDDASNAELTDLQRKQLRL